MVSEADPSSASGRVSKELWDSNISAVALTLVDENESFKALGFKEQLAQTKDKEESFGFEKGDEEELESGRKWIRFADMEEAAIDLIPKALLCLLERALRLCAMLSLVFRSYPNYFIILSRNKMLK